MTMHDAMAALDAAKASGDVAAMVAAAEAIAAASSAPAAPKAARKPRAPKDDRPAWFTETAKVAKRASRIKHSLAVTFTDGQHVQVNAWQAKADAPIAVGRALHVAVAFLRHRAQKASGAAAWRDEVPGFAHVELVGGDAFDPAECTSLTTEARARISAPEAETAEARIARLTADWDWRVAALARAKRDAVYAEARAAAVVIEPGDVAAAARRDAIREDAACEVRNAERMVAQCERFLAEAEGRVAAMSPAPGVVAFDDEDELAAIEAEPLEAAYPDAEDDDEGATNPGEKIDMPSVGASSADGAVTTLAEAYLEAVSPDMPLCVAVCSSHRARERFLARWPGAADFPVTGYPFGAFTVPASFADCVESMKGVRLIGLPRKPRQPRQEAASPVSAPVGALEAPSPVLADPARPSTWMAVYSAEIAARRARAVSMAAPGRAVRMVRDDGMKALAGPDPSRPGGFRLTRFCIKDAPHGHIDVASLEEACELGLRMGYEPAPPVRRLDAPPPVASFDPDRAAARDDLDEQHGRDADDIAVVSRLAPADAAARLDFSRAAPSGDRLALVLIPWDMGGTSIAWLARGGGLHGCRDVSAGECHDDIVRAWWEDADRLGLEVVDLRPGEDPDEGEAPCEGVSDGPVGASDHPRLEPVPGEHARDGAEHLILRGRLGASRDAQPVELRARRDPHAVLAGEARQDALARHEWPDRGRSSGFRDLGEVERRHGFGWYRSRPPPIGVRRSGAVDRRAA